MTHPRVAVDIGGTFTDICTQALGVATSRSWSAGASCWPRGSAAC